MSSYENQSEEQKGIKQNQEDNRNFLSTLVAFHNRNAIIIYILLFFIVVIGMSIGMMMH